MIIDQLPALAAVEATDEIPVERGTTTYKARADALRAGLYSADNPPPYPVTSVNGQMGDVNTNPPDYVVENGTSGNWTYRKWNSGFLEAWFMGSVTFTTEDGPYNGMYRHVQLLDNLSLFVSTAAIFAGGSNSNAFITDASISSNQVRLVLSHVSSISGQIPVTATSIYETGRWTA